MAQLPPRKRRDVQGTYVVPERNLRDERVRLRIQDQLVTRQMRGVLAEQPTPSDLHQVLDVGCGPGGWVIEAARMYPQMELVGVDIHSRMIEYASQQAQQAGVEHRVSFLTMDALVRLDFPDAQFDLVNLRYGMSFVRTWDWRMIIGEMARVTRPGGILRLSEVDVVFESTSPALTQLSNALMIALARAGYLFEPVPSGIKTHLPSLLRQYAHVHPQEILYPQDYPAGTPAVQALCEDIQYTFQVIHPFLHKWGAAPEDYDALYAQAVEEMGDPTFSASGSILTVWGQIPLKTRRPADC